MTRNRCWREPSLRAQPSSALSTTSTVGDWPGSTTRSATGGRSANRSAIGHLHRIRSPARAATDRPREGEVAADTVTVLQGTPEVSLWKAVVGTGLKKPIPGGVS